MNYSRFHKRIIVSGGAGFIGSNLLLYLVPRYTDYLFINLDCLTYAGNLANLKPIEGKDNYRFEKINIRHADKVRACFEKYNTNAVIHLAAESHVDRSIYGPSDFVNTNILGTFNMLEAARKMASIDNDFRFLHVSTDEVYGSIDSPHRFTESSPYSPSSPYSASKASADHLVASYHKTYQLDTVITNSSNNYGPLQFPEKLIPLMICNALNGVAMPLYGDGKNVRNWLYVEDHCRALDMAFHNGRPGARYNIGGETELENIELVRMICRIMDEVMGGNSPLERLITFVEDRAGHDFRYALDSSLIKKELDWKPRFKLKDCLKKTVDWYLENRQWLDKCISGEYRDYYHKVYDRRQL